MTSEQWQYAFAASVGTSQRALVAADSTGSIVTATSTQSVSVTSNTSAV